MTLEFNRPRAISIINRDLLSLRHLVFAALLVLAFLLWGLLERAAFGDRSPENGIYLLATGWAAFALFLFLMVYALRKRAHRWRLSPEPNFFAGRERLERTQASIEEALHEIATLSARLRAGEIVSEHAAIEDARRVLRTGGADRFVRVRAEKVADGSTRLYLEKREPMLRLVSWLRAHLFLGIAAAFLVYFHGGGRAHSAMGLWLNSLSLAVILSGVVGGILWVLMPEVLTRKEGDLSTEKAFSLLDHYRRKVEEQESRLRRTWEESLLQKNEANVDQALADARRRALENPGHRGDGENDHDRTMKNAVGECLQGLARVAATAPEPARSLIPRMTRAFRNSDATLEEWIRGQQKSIKDSLEAVTRAKDKGGAKTEESALLIDALKALQSTVRIPAELEDLHVLRLQLRQVKSRWSVLELYKTVLHCWRVVHVPCSLALIAVVLVHIVSVWWY